MSETEAIKNLINQAELAFGRVISSRVGPEIRFQNHFFQFFSNKFNSRTKISRFFMSFWGLHLTNTMICNLGLIIINRRLAGVLGDLAVLPFEVVSIKILRRTPNRLFISALLTNVTRETIFYTLLKQQNGTFRIIERSNTINDDRYKPCVSKPIRRVTIRLPEEE